MSAVILLALRWKRNNNMVPKEMQKIKVVYFPHLTTLTLNCL
jgi:hypothetical protein